MSLLGPGFYVSRSLSTESKTPTVGGATKTDIRELESRIDRAMMACEAMWSLMRDKLGVTDEELVERINEIDLSDGQLDGKVRKTVVACPKCNRTINPRLPKCMYCGQPVLHDPFA